MNWTYLSMHVWMCPKYYHHNHRSVTALVYVPVRACVFVCVLVCLRVCRYACACACVCTCTCVCGYFYVWGCTCACTCTCVCMCVFAPVRAYSCLYACICMCVGMYVYVRVCVNGYIKYILNLTLSQPNECAWKVAVGEYTQTQLSYLSPITLKYLNILSRFSLPLLTTISYPHSEYDFDILGWINFTESYHERGINTITHNVTLSVIM